MRVWEGASFMSTKVRHTNVKKTWGFSLIIGFGNIRSKLGSEAAACDYVSNFLHRLKAAGDFPFLFPAAASVCSSVFQLRFIFDELTRFNSSTWARTPEPHTEMGGRKAAQIVKTSVHAALTYNISHYRIQQSLASSRFNFCGLAFSRFFKARLDDTQLSDWWMSRTIFHLKWVI